MTETPAVPPPALGDRAPAPLLAAAALVAVEATVILVLGLAEILTISGARVMMGVTTAVFFLVYGAGLALCAWSVSRSKSWARSPIVVAQLIQLLVAWSFRGGSTTPVAIIVGVLALIVLVAIFHPDSRAALDDDG